VPGLHLVPGNRLCCKVFMWVSSDNLSNCQDSILNFECCPRCIVWTLKSSHAEELGAQHGREGI
jgi:hypothetical protein